MKTTATKAVGLSLLLIAAFGIVAPAASANGAPVAEDGAGINQNCVETNPVTVSVPCCVWNRYLIICL